jgi:hypothetical protein
VPIVAASDTILGSGVGAFGYTTSSNTSATSFFSATTHSTADRSVEGNTSSVTVAGVPAAQVPEPSTSLLLGGGLIGLSFLVHRPRAV